MLGINDGVYDGNSGSMSPRSIKLKELSFFAKQGNIQKGRIYRFNEMEHFPLYIPFYDGFAFISEELLRTTSYKLLVVPWQICASNAYG